MQTRSLVDFGELSLNRAMRIYGPVGDLSEVGGRYYPSKAPLMSFAAVPVYAVLRSFVGGRPGVVPEIPLVFFSRLFLTVFPTLLALLLVERLLAQYVSLAIALAVTWTYALGTLAFSYSLLFMSHQTTATLREVIESNGFRLESLEWLNLLGIPGWFLKSRVLRRRSVPGFQVRLYDRVSPLLARLESTLALPVGMSLLAVARATPGAGVDR